MKPAKMSITTNTVVDRNPGLLLFQNPKNLILHIRQSMNPKHGCHFIKFNDSKTMTWLPLYTTPTVLNLMNPKYYYYYSNIISPKHGRRCAGSDK
jgi:hypothetical protein